MDEKWFDFRLVLARSYPLVIEPDCKTSIEILPPIFKNFYMKYSIAEGSTGILKGKKYSISSLLNINHIHYTNIEYDTSFGIFGTHRTYSILVFGYYNSYCAYFVGYADWNKDLIYCINPNEFSYRNEPKELTQQMRNRFNKRYKIANNINILAKKLQHGLVLDVYDTYDWSRLALFPVEDE